MRYILAFLLLISSAHGAGITSPTLATNPSGVADFGTNVPFIDLMKQSRPWLSTGATQRDWDYLEANGHLDSNGWPSTIPAGNNDIQTVWDWPSAHGNYNGGQSYTVEWLGTASISITGAVENVVNVDSNTITFDFTSSGGALGLVITSMSAAPNNPRNITVIRDDLQTLYDGGQRINPDYALFLQDMKQLRFMDWGQTNNSTQVDWADRATTSDVTYATGFGVPIERQVELCNLTMADCWVNFPHQFTDAAITSMVTYVRDNLNSNLKAYYELSNEVWNAGAFNHQAYFLAQARADWTSSGAVADFEIALHYYGKRSAEAFAIVDTLYAGITARRVNVLGSLNDDNDFVHQAVMDADTWNTEDSGNYVKPATVAQALTIAPYYGVQMLTGNTATIQTQYTAGTHIDWIYNYLTNAANDDSVASLITNIGIANTAATGESLDLIMYEGLRHYLHGGTATGDVLTALVEFSRHAKDADLVLQVWEAWEADGDGPLMVFSDIGGHSAFGAWTLAEYYGDTSPYSEMLTALNNSTAPWWGDTRDMSNTTISGATSYAIDPGIGRPIRVKREYNYLNSLREYVGGDSAPFSQHTKTNEWLVKLAGETGKAYGASGRFGQMDSHVVPGGDDLGSAATGFEVTTNGTWAGWNTADITHVEIVPDNFVSQIWLNQPTAGVLTGSISYPNRIIDYIDTHETNLTRTDVAYRLFVGVPAPDQIVTGSFPWSDTEWQEWRDYALDRNPPADSGTTGNYGEYWDDVVAIVKAARPAVDFDVIPIWRIMAKIMELPVLSSLDETAWFGDDSPHGSANLHAIQGWIVHMFDYKTKAPYTYAFDPEGSQETGVSSIINTNRVELIDFIWSELGGNTPPVVVPVVRVPVRFGSGCFRFAGGCVAF